MCSRPQLSALRQQQVDHDRAAAAYVEAAKRDREEIARLAAEAAGLRAAAEAHKRAAAAAEEEAARQVGVLYHNLLIRPFDEPFM